MAKSKNKQRKKKLVSSESQEVAALAGEAAKLALATTGVVPKPQRIRQRRQRANVPAIQPDSLDRDIAERAVERAAAGTSSTMVPLLPSRGPRNFNPRLLGRTVPGRSWAIEALHPCGEFQGAGMPDTFSADVNVFEMKDEVIIGFDATMFSTAPTSPMLYDVHMLFPPIPEYACIYRLVSTGSNGLQISNWKIVYASSLAASNTTTSTNTLRTSGYAAHRITAQGETVELNAPQLADQGRIYIGQRVMADYVEDMTVTSLATTGPAIKSEVMKLLRIDHLSTPGNLIQAVANPYQANARDGGYIVHKFANPLMGYQFHGTLSSTMTTLTATGATASTYPTSALLIQTGQTSTDDEIITPQTFVAGSFMTGSNLPASLGDYAFNQFGIGASPPCDMTLAECFVTGISVGSSSAPGAFVNIKCRKVIEAQCKMGSPVAPYAKSSPLWDEVAINAVIKYQQVQPHAYPACENSFGTVMGRVFSFLSRYVKPVISTVSKFVPIPGASAVGDVLGGAIETGNGYFNGGEF